jgi:hypothetical protein
MCLLLHVYSLYFLPVSSVSSVLYQWPETAHSWKHASMMVEMLLEFLSWFWWFFFGIIFVQYSVSHIQLWEMWCSKSKQYSDDLQKSFEWYWLITYRFSFSLLQHSIKWLEKDRLLLKMTEDVDYDVEGSHLCSSEVNWYSGLFGPVLQLNMHICIVL